MKDYRKYKWFYTSSGKLVVGGKSDSSNDSLIREMKESGKDYLTMHTSHPGSPFTIIMDNPEKVSKDDIEECATYTGCFSRAWKQGRKSTEVHVFKISQLEKKKGMKTGTWGISGKAKNIKVELKLALTVQKKVLRAVPEKSSKKTLLKICPGKTDKTKMLEKIAVEIGDVKADRNEILAALPAGGVKIC
ncbi:hypothetical protein CO038_00075 [Candidatus Pacearchaeota archaeon CG_4_9_14_0_2_um_filter_39_13]|nr:DUF814 domain-containing protein [Candidatus Pacearchaeota archaeon]OIO43570.1 MAG: hypothetical protein AUJ64_02140 [Candidatus Pacearchaeota archaeon CG1_02_39_14]PJC45135.1 MAG: hypothetical protein CO038_00075 [Candidatus Pacearchaeota archaeon CG_4_9_14_0_2_um_filter_39_13]